MIPNKIFSFYDAFFTKSIIPTLIPDNKWKSSLAITNLQTRLEPLLLTDTSFCANVNCSEESIKFNLSIGSLCSLTEIIYLTMNARLDNAECSNEIEKKTHNGYFPSFRTRDSVFFDYSYLLNCEPTDTIYNVFLVQPFKHDNEIELFYYLLDYSTAFISLHERAHIFGGHWEYIRNEYRRSEHEFKLIFDHSELTYMEPGKVVFTGKQLLRQKLELLADIKATTELIKRNTQKSYSYIYDHPAFNDQSDIVYFTSLSIGLTYLILFKNEKLKGFHPEYPRIAYRLWNLVLGVLGQAIITKEEAKYFLKGIIDALKVGEYLSHFNLMPEFEEIKVGTENGEDYLYWHDGFYVEAKIFSYLDNLSEKLKKYSKQWNQ